MKYKVLASLREDMNEGWVWIANSKFEPRSVVKIKNHTNGKYIYCECLEIDSNYISIYNNPKRLRINEKENIITINSWYRIKLGSIKTKNIYDIEIKSANNFYGKFMSCMHHPQIVVRMATILAGLSIIMGIVSLLISFL